VKKVLDEANIKVALQDTSARQQTKKKSSTSTLTKLIQKHAYPGDDSNSEDAQINEEIHKYLLTVIPEDAVEDFDVLKYWRDNQKSLPLLSHLPKKYLCIPVTSTTSERAFSHAGVLINAKRSSLGHNVVEKTLFIHDNYSLVKKTLFSNLE
jgi:DNA primase